MHLLRADQRSLDETAPAVDLAHSPAEVVFLSFSDSDLAGLAAAHDPRRHPSLRLASLAALRNPYSVDLYVETVCAKARFVLVRLLGGLDYWRYGVDELAAAARRGGGGLAIVPGDAMDDPRLDQASTLARADLRRLWAYFQEGGPENLGACLDFVSAKLGRALAPSAPRRVEAFGLFDAAPRRAGGADRPRALIVFYRSIYLAGDTAPIVSLGQALGRKGLDATAAYVSSLKDAQAVGPLSRLIADLRPDIVLNATAFSARLDDRPGALDAADAPVLQVILAGSSADEWRASGRGLAAADLAMNVVLPEVDGRIVTRAISFKEAAARAEGLEFTPLIHRPEPSRVDFVAALAANWVALRRKPRAERRVALVLTDYPAKGGRAGYAIGLDAFESAVVIARHLRDQGYAFADPPPSSVLAAMLSSGPESRALSLHDYERAFALLPDAFAAEVRARWGEPAADPAARDGAFHFRVARFGGLVVVVQPDRGRREQRKAEYHDAGAAPRHAYLAFYLWLRAQSDALVHCGAHGTLEWLPGKAVALSERCAPEVALGPTPLIYPFIVNNPGEAAQAKRRSAAVIVSHLTPTLTPAGAHGATAELEALFDEYAQAQGLDARRAKRLAELILSRADETGLMEECGVRDGDDALLSLDAWLCDLKEMRIADGLHVFGRSPQDQQRAAWLEAAQATGGTAETIVADRLERCGPAELEALTRALDGRFVQPGPAGAPARGRLDVLPTGRNLYAVDPRAAPTRIAWEIGRKTADAVLARYAQDHGEWPRRVVLDLWGSATMRTGGDDLAQALALLGVRPLWDAASNRVSGFEILPLAALGRARVDVTLRISGLFRDVFPMQIGLFAAAARAVAALDEASEDNPLAGEADARRVFGAAPGLYGAGLGSSLAHGDWRQREDLGRAYLDMTSHAYSGDGAAEAAAGAFVARAAAADAFVHVQDLPGQDVLDSDAFAEHEGGFAAGAALLDKTPALYHVDATRPEQTRVRTVKEEVARVLRARATNPRWIEGQMRHGHRGAAEIAETVDNLFAFAALAGVVSSRQFDALFDATCGDARVRRFLLAANPQAASAIAEKFEDAARRGLWTSRRNSTVSVLAAMRDADA